jgi:hypothetical protein
MTGIVMPWQRISIGRYVHAARVRTTGADPLQPPKEVIDVIEQLCNNEIGALVDLCFQIFAFFIFAEYALGMTVWVG